MQFTELGNRGNGKDKNEAKIYQNHSKFIESLIMILYDNNELETVHLALF